jgi:hypothetical protein
MTVGRTIVIRLTLRLLTLYLNMFSDASVAPLSCFESGLSFSYSENSKVKEYNIRQLKAYTYSSLIPDLTPGVRYTE